MKWWDLDLNQGPSTFASKRHKPQYASKQSEITVFQRGTKQPSYLLCSGAKNKSDANQKSQIFQKSLLVQKQTIYHWKAL